MLDSLVTEDKKDSLSAMRSADELISYLYTVVTHQPHRGEDEKKQWVALIKETQRRLRVQTNPEMFDENGRYK